MRVPGLQTTTRSLSEHTHARRYRCGRNTQRQTFPPLLKSPKGIWGVCVYLLSSRLALGVWPGFHWGGRTPSILLTTGLRYSAERWKKNDSEQGRASKLAQKKE